MDRLGPFEPAPTLAVGVSGGADSMALAVLARDWARARGGACLALVADHGLRAGSGAEAALAGARLAAAGIAFRLLVLAIPPGPGLAERARDARLGALRGACRQAGILHLLLAHHAADQAETIAMRMLRGSHPHGLAGMASLAETADCRILRPLLSVAPVRLRLLLLDAGMAWSEDPTNRDPAALRARLRGLRRDAAGDGTATRAAVAAAAARGCARAAAQAAQADWLARHATLHPEAFVTLDALPPDPGTLGAVLRVVAGSGRAPRDAALTRFLRQPGAATLGGVAIAPAPQGWVFRREAAAVRPGGGDGGLWDGRLRLLPGPAPDRAHLPLAVRGTLPAGRAAQWAPAAPLTAPGFLPPPI